MRLLTAVSGVRVPQQAPESTRKRVLFFYISGRAPLRVQRHARGQARRHAEPQWTRLRPRGRTIAIPSRCSLRGFESRGRRHRAPENGCFCFVSGSHPCACNGTRAGKPADTRNRSGRDCAVGRTIAIPSRCSLRGFESRGKRHRAPERRVLFFYVSGHAPLRVQWHARGQARRHAEPQWTRLRRRANNCYSVALLLTGVEQSCQRQRQNNEPKGKRLRHFNFKVISGARACAGGDGEGEGGGGTGHAPY